MAAGARERILLGDRMLAVVPENWRKPCGYCRSLVLHWAIKNLPELFDYIGTFPDRPAAIAAVV
jgi:hypothetical protein